MTEKICVDAEGFEGYLIEGEIYNVFRTAARGVLKVKSSIGWIHCAASRFR